MLIADPSPRPPLKIYARPWPYPCYFSLVFVRTIANVVFLSKISSQITTMAL